MVFLAFNIAYGVSITATPYILRAWSESRGQDMWLYVSLYAFSAVWGFFAISGFLWYVFTIIIIILRAREL